MTDHLSFLPLTLAILLIASLVALFVFACAREWQLWRYSTKPYDEPKLRTRPMLKDLKLTGRMISRDDLPEVVVHSLESGSAFVNGKEFSSPTSQ